MKENSEGRLTAIRRPGAKGSLSRSKSRWWAFSTLCLVVTIVLIPIASVVWLSFQPGLGSTSSELTLENFQIVFQKTKVLRWMGNSLLLTLLTVITAIMIAAPAGYVLSRGRGRMVSVYSLILFMIQSLPGVIAVIPLFVLFANLRLADSLSGVFIIYVGSALSVSIWMMASYYDSIPISLEEAAWVDGCSVIGGFARVVLRNSLPGLLSTAIFCFLLAWNDYLISLVFLRSDSNFTLPIGLQTFFQQNATNWGPVTAISVIMLIPPVIVFTVLNRYFSIGGIGGSLGGR